MKVYDEIKLGLEQAVEYNKGNMKARKTVAETPSPEKPSIKRRMATQRLDGEITEIYAISRKNSELL